MEHTQLRKRLCGVPVVGEYPNPFIWIWTTDTWTLARKSSPSLYNSTFQLLPSAGERRVVTSSRRCLLTSSAEEVRLGGPIRAQRGIDGAKLADDRSIDPSAIDRQAPRGRFTSWKHSTGTGFVQSRPATVLGRCTILAGQFGCPIYSPAIVTRHKSRTTNDLTSINNSARNSRQSDSRKGDGTSEANEAVLALVRGTTLGPRRAYTQAIVLLAQQGDADSFRRQWNQWFIKSRSRWRQHRSRFRKKDRHTSKQLNA